MIRSEVVQLNRSSSRCKLTAASALTRSPHHANGERLTKLLLLLRKNKSFANLKNLLRDQAALVEQAARTKRMAVLLRNLECLYQQLALEMQSATKA
jgi:hypothetical protein